MQTTRSTENEFIKVILCPRCNEEVIVDRNIIKNHYVLKEVVNYHRISFVTVECSASGRVVNVC